MAKAKSPAAPAVNAGPNATSLPVTACAAKAQGTTDVESAPVASAPVVYSVCSAPTPHLTGDAPASGASSTDKSAAQDSVAAANPAAAIVCVPLPSAPSSTDHAGGCAAVHGGGGAHRSYNALMEAAVAGGAVSRHPRGLHNRGNLCFANAVLQCLLGCSPLYRFLRMLTPAAVPPSMPTLSAMVDFAAQFVHHEPDPSPAAAAAAAAAGGGGGYGGGRRGAVTAAGLYGVVSRFAPTDPVAAGGERERYIYRERQERERERERESVLEIWREREQEKESESERKKARETGRRGRGRGRGRGREERGIEVKEKIECERLTDLQKQRAIHRA